MKRIRNIQRIDNTTNNTHAWFVQVQRDSIAYRKMFSDGVYGSKTKALAAAKEFKEKTLLDVSDRKYHFRLRTKLRRNNSSGVAGVGRYSHIANHDTGTRFIFWLAYWDDANGIRKSRKFSVLKYGERKAEKLAIAERKRRLKEVCAAKYV